MKSAMENSGTLGPEMSCFLENLPCDYFMVTALRDADKFSKDQQISGLRSTSETSNVYCLLKILLLLE